MVPATVVLKASQVLPVGVNSRAILAIQCYSLIILSDLDSVSALSWKGDGPNQVIPVTNHPQIGVCGGIDGLAHLA